MAAKPKTDARSPKESRRKIYSAPALEKGLDILELLAKEPESISLREIAGRLGRSVGEIFRMLAVLEQRGFVRGGSGSERYQLSMKMFQLAHWHLPVNRLTRAADGPMRRLALRTGQSCHIATLYGSKVVVLSKHDSYEDRSFSIRVGAESPIFASCSGRLFYALAGEFTRETLLAELKEDGEDISLAETIAGLHDTILARGILEMPSAQIEGIVDIGTPIVGHDGNMAASLVIPFLHRLGDDDAARLAQTRDAIVETGKEISAALGYNA